MATRMRIVSFNIGKHGLALTLAETTKSGTLTEFLDHLGQPDIVCFQEIKTLRSGLSEQSALARGYSCFFACHRSISNWSGVLTCVRDSIPVCAVQAGLFGALSHEICDLRTSRAAVECGGALSLDSEGRVLLTDHGAFVLANIYLPALGGTDRETRVAVKAALCEGLAAAIAELQGRGRRVIVCGDFNVAHQPQDHCDAATWSKGHGGAPFESNTFRVWLSSMLVKKEHLASAALSQLRGTRPLLVDSFRAFYPDKAGAYTCWSVAAASRVTNYGTRIDYVLVDAALCAAADCDRGSEPKASPSAASSPTGAGCSAEGAVLAENAGALGCLLSADVLQSVLGSDHCPVDAILLLQLPTPGKTLPHPASSACFPEFSRRQQSLVGFWQPRLDPTPCAALVASSSTSNAANTISCVVPVLQPEYVRDYKVALPDASARMEAPQRAEGVVKRKRLAAFSADTCDSPSTGGIASSEVISSSFCGTEVGSGISDPLGRLSDTVAVASHHVSKQSVCLQKSEVVARPSSSNWATTGAPQVLKKQQQLNFSNASVLRAPPSAGAGLKKNQQKKLPFLQVAASAQTPSTLQSSDSVCGPAAGRAALGPPSTSTVGTQAAHSVPSSVDVVDLCLTTEGSGEESTSASAESTATSASPAAPTSFASSVSAGLAAGGPPPVPVPARALDTWASLLRPLPPPLCRCTVDPVPAVLRRVRKAGPTQGRSFYTCPKPQGAPGHPAAACSLFLWADVWARKHQEQQQALQRRLGSEQGQQPQEEAVPALSAPQQPGAVSGSVSGGD